MVLVVDGCYLILRVNNIAEKLAIPFEPFLFHIQKN